MNYQSLFGSLFFFTVSVLMLLYFYKRDKKIKDDEKIFGLMYRIKPYGLFVVIAIVSLYGIVLEIIRIFQ